MLDMNARKYYRETLETELGKIGISGKRLTEINDKIIDGISTLRARHRGMGSIRLPDTFFDFSRSMRVIARQEGIKPENVLANLEKYVNDLFEIHELFPNIISVPTTPVKQKRAPKPGDLRVKALPKNDVLIAAYTLYKKNHGKAPPLSSREGLPEGSPTWGTINMKVREQFGISLRDLAKKTVKGENPQNNTPIIIKDRKRRHKNRITDEEIVRVAVEIKRTTGRLPTMSSAHMGLPEDTVGWKTIIRDLATKGLSIGRLVKAHGENGAANVNVTPQDEVPPNIASQDVVPHDTAPQEPAMPQETEAQQEAEAPQEPEASVAVMPEITDVSIPPETSALFPVQAEHVFLDCARLIKKNRELPTIPNFYDFVAGKSVPALNRDFKQGMVGGWERFTREKPTCLKDFLLSVGMAETKNGRVLAAPAHRIREIERTHGL